MNIKSYSFEILKLSIIIFKFAFFYDYSLTQLPHRPHIILNLENKWKWKFLK